MGLHDCHRLLRAHLRRRGAHPGREGAAVVRVSRRAARQRRLRARQLHDVADDALHLLRRHRRHRQRLRLRDADAGRIEMVSGSPRSRRRPDGRRLRRRFGDLRHPRERLARAERRLAHDVPDPRRDLLRDDDDRYRAAQESAGRLPSAELASTGYGDGRARRLHDARDARDADVLRAVGRVLSGHDGGPDDDQPARAVHACRRSRRDRRDAVARRHLAR